MKVCILGDPRSPNLNDLICSVFADDDVFIVSSIASNKHRTHRLSSCFCGNSLFAKLNYSGKRHNHALKSLMMPLLYSRRFSLLVYYLLYWFKLLELPFLAFQCKRIIQSERPHVVLAYRTQLEGYMAALAAPGSYILFTQGSDLTFFGLRDPFHFLLTCFTVSKSAAIITDCSRDLGLILHKFLKVGRPSLIAIGNGGVSFRASDRPLSQSSRPLSMLCIRPPAPYIDYETLFRAIALVLSRGRCPSFSFSLIAQPHFHDQIKSLALQCGLDHSCIQILPFMSKAEYRDLLLSSDIAISPSTTDGIPVSLVEAMNYGCFPVAATLDSLKDIIVDGVNGFLYPQYDYVELSFLLDRVLQSSEVRSMASTYSASEVLPFLCRDYVSPRIRDFILKHSQSISLRPTID